MSLHTPNSDKLHIVLGVLRNSIGAPSCQHVLLTGPGNAGRAMHAHIAAELRTDPDLCARLLPVRLPDKPCGPSCLADLWLEALLAIARKLAQSQVVGSRLPSVVPRRSGSGTA